MNGIKCNRCGLVNVSADAFCRRCEQNLEVNPMPAALPSDVVKGGSYFPYIVVAIITGVIAAVSFGFYSSLNKVTADDEKRIERQTKEQADSLESRRTIDRVCQRSRR